MSPSPPRGMIRSMRPWSESISLTTARSADGTTARAAGGSPAEATAAARTSAIGAVRAERLRPAAQQHGVPRLEAQRRGVRGHVGPGLVDDPDHPEGTRMRPTCRPLGRRHMPVTAHPPGRGDRRSAALPRAMAVDPGLGQREAIHEGGRLAGGAGARPRPGVVRQDARPATFRQPRGHRQERAVLLLPAGAGQFAGGGPRARGPSRGCRSHSWITSCGRSGRRRLQDDEIVPVDHLVVRLVAQHRRDPSLCRPLILSISSRRVVHHAPAELPAVRIQQADHVSRPERLLCPASTPRGAGSCPPRPAPPWRPRPPRSRRAAGWRRPATACGLAIRLRDWEAGCRPPRPADGPHRLRVPAAGHDRGDAGDRGPMGGADLGRHAPDAGGAPVSSCASRRT